MCHRKISIFRLPCLEHWFVAPGPEQWDRKDLDSPFRLEIHLAVVTLVFELLTPYRYPQMYKQVREKMSLERRKGMKRALILVGVVFLASSVFFFPQAALAQGKPILVGYPMILSGGGALFGQPSLVGARDGGEGDQ